jgi:hypothetical protein
VTTAAFPALYQAADAASTRAQKTYLMLFRCTLLLLVSGALLGSVSVKSSGWYHASSIIAAVLLGLSFVLSATLQILSPEKTWFGGRAVAESIKSITWRYMVGGEPYGVELETRVADAKFADELRSILQERRSLAWRYADPADAPQITPEMQSKRREPAETRLSLYVRERVQDQRRWYGAKGAEAERLHLKWFWISIVSQATALTSAILMVSVTDAPINPTGALSAVAASGMAWLQMKRYQDLAQAYALAAHELGLIEIQAEHVRTLIRAQALQVHAEAQLASFVANAENAISREHTMWVARKDVS